MNKKLLDGITANTTGAWTDVTQGGDYIVFVDGSADLDGGTLALEIGDSAGNAATQDTTNLSFTAAPEPFVVTLGSGTKVRMSLTGSTSPALTATIQKAHA